MTTERSHKATIRIGDHKVVVTDVVITAKPISYISWADHSPEVCRNLARATIKLREVTMLNYVIRRKTPRHDGSRYFNANGPAEGAVARASRFTEEEATVRRRALKEPHLWDVIPINEAVEIEKKALAELQAEQRPRRVRGMTAAAILALAAGFHADMPRRGT